MRKIRKEGTLPVSLQTFLQTLYISSRLYGQNGLATLAQACAFGLAFSLFPIIFLVLSVVLHLVSGYTSVVESLYSYVDQFLTFEQYSSIVSSVMSVKTIGLPEIIAGIGIFWFARRLFFTLTSGYNKIFGKKKVRTLWKASLVGIVVEAVFIVMCTLSMMALVAARSIASVLNVTHLFPEVAVWFQSWIYPLVTKLLPRVVLYLVVFFSYRYYPGTKPSFKLCAWSAFCTVLMFWIFQLFFTLFTNMSRYNLVYGVVTNVIVFLLEMVTFFNIYFFIAQYIFVYQYFKELLLAELYLIPTTEKKTKLDALRSWLFLKDEWLATTNNVIEVEARSEINVNGEEESGFVYYVAKGSVLIELPTGPVYEQGKGTFFGEVSAILERPREMSVIAKTDVKLLKIERSMFVKLLESDSLVTKTLLSKVSSAFDNI